MLRILYIVVLYRLSFFSQLAARGVYIAAKSPSDSDCYAIVFKRLPESSNAPAVSRTVLSAADLVQRYEVDM